MNTSIKIKRVFLIIISSLFLILWTYLIFSMSLKSADESSEISGGLLIKMLYYIKSSLWFDVEFGILHNIFRKLAHFTEFFILGFFSFGFIKAIKSRPLYSLVYCLFVAITDELIQFFYGFGRSCQITDIILDFFGSLFSYIIIYIISLIIFKLRIKKA